jgi:hypothetical protein
MKTLFEGGWSEYPQSKAAESRF